jgi:hypothetical protein
MINLIPPAAKKSITVEYWLRVISVWFFTTSVALVLGAVLMIPAYVLINLQVAAYSDSAASATQKLATLKDVSSDLNVANQQAKALIDGLRYDQLSDYVALFRGLESSEIALSQINLSRTKDGVAPIQLSGTATDRQALAHFRDNLLSQDGVDSVDLPISNLAKDKDISFTITVTMKKK